ncbi:anticodon-binding domain-like motif protein [Ranid herpesvirus 3]|uniref:Anticodon-binding domain-like motif protein n=1 Tax=Ranid herpesvirus 3 TaxID=1987509 RepID=A0A1X9T542_9VIRU|nr:anticodon-binding domain-like motif protein [Ranid herpesvirus 3]ARR28819.1 anticodon-binding domain-like motif protein [Ranid herpesvirus 3]
MSLSRNHNTNISLMKFIKDFGGSSCGCTAFLLTGHTSQPYLMLLLPYMMSKIHKCVFGNSYPIEGIVPIGIKKISGSFSLVVGCPRDGSVSEINSEGEQLYYGRRAHSLYNYCSGDWNHETDSPLCCFPQDAFQNILRMTVHDACFQHKPYAPLDRNPHKHYVNKHTLVQHYMQHIDLLSVRSMDLKCIQKMLAAIRGIPQLIFNNAIKTYFSLFIPMVKDDFHWNGMNLTVVGNDNFVPVGIIHHTQELACDRTAYIRVLFIKLGGSGGYFSCDPLKGCLIRMAGSFLELSQICAQTWFSGEHRLFSFNLPMLEKPCDQILLNCLYFTAYQAIGTALANGGWEPLQRVPQVFQTMLNPTYMEKGFYETEDITTEMVNSLLLLQNTNRNPRDGNAEESTAKRPRALGPFETSEIINL